MSERVEERPTMAGDDHRAVFVDTNLDTHLAIHVSSRTTVNSLKRIVLSLICLTFFTDHPLWCFNWNAFPFSELGFTEYFYSCFSTNPWVITAIFAFWVLIFAYCTIFLNWIFFYCCDSTNPSIISATFSFWGFEFGYRKSVLDVFNLQA